jgi:hypothetical protein
MMTPPTLLAASFVVHFLKSRPVWREWRYQGEISRNLPERPENSETRDLVSTQVRRILSDGDERRFWIEPRVASFSTARTP